MPLDPGVSDSTGCNQDNMAGAVEHVSRSKAAAQAIMHGLHPDTLRGVPCLELLHTQETTLHVYMVPVLPGPHLPAVVGAHELVALDAPL